MIKTHGMKLFSYWKYYIKNRVRGILSGLQKRVRVRLGWTCLSLVLPNRLSSGCWAVYAFSGTRGVILSLPLNTPTPTPTDILAVWQLVGCLADLHAQFRGIMVFFLSSS